MTTPAFSFPDILVGFTHEIDDTNLMISFKGESASFTLPEDILEAEKASDKLSGLLTLAFEAGASSTATEAPAAASPEPAPGPADPGTASTEANPNAATMADPTVPAPQPTPEQISSNPA